MKYLKKLLIRIVIVLVFFLALLFGLETILKFSSIKHDWYKENELINKMNSDKLKNENWTSSPLWLHKNEEIPEKGEGKTRILIVGDSYIWGDGYDNANNIWWQQFKLMLKEHGYNDVEVVAAGLGGYSTQQELEGVLKDKELIAQVDPDLIIIGFVKNDTEFRNADASLMVRYFYDTDLLYYDNHKLGKIFKEKFPYVYQKMSLLLSNKYSNNQKFQEIFGYNYYNWMTVISSGDWLDKYEQEVIKPLSRYIKTDLNIPTLFYFTNANDEPPELNVRPLLNKYEIENYYLPDYLRADNFDTSFDINNHKINSVNNHPSVFDCQVYAAYLIKILEESHPYVLGPKTPYVKTLNINDWMPYKVNPTKINEDTYEITYPSSKNKQDFLSLPIEQPYIKLNLEHSINIKSISIEGDNIDDIDIYINRKDKDLGYDTQAMYKLDKTSDYEWIINDDSLVTSINISAKIKKGQEQKLKIKINGL